MFGGEASIDYYNENRPEGVDLKVWPIGLCGLVYPAGGWYAIGGMSWVHTTIDVPRTFLLGDDTKSTIGYQLGGGVEVPLLFARVAADVRWHFVDYSFDDLPETIGSIDADSFRVTLSAFF